MRKNLHNLHTLNTILHNMRRKRTKLPLPMSMEYMYRRIETQLLVLPTTWPTWNKESSFVKFPSDASPDVLRIF